MPTRQQYVAARIGARMQQRGEKMILRRTTLSPGPVPYRNPPDISSDLAVVTGVRTGGQAYLGISGVSAIGRLVAGDVIQCSATPTSQILLTWTVGVMPAGVATDADGIPLVDDTGVPIGGIPTPYSPDSLAAGDIWPAIPVSAPGDPDPGTSIGNVCQMVFQADQPVYGMPLSLERMTLMGWTETNTLGLRIAAYNPGGGQIRAPKVDDVVLVGDKAYNIMTVGQMFAAGVQFFYPIQAR